MAVLLGFCIFLFLWQLKMLTLFKGLGNYMLQVEEAKRMFLELLERRKQYHYCIDNRSSSRLSHIEVQILCLLLEASLVALKPGCFISDYVDQLVEVLKMDGASVEDPTIVKPCVAILQNLTSLFYDSLKSETQDELFANIVFLFRNDNADIRNATREALTRINISCSTIAKFLDVVRSQGHRNASSNKMKRKKQFWFQATVLGHDVSNKGGKTLFFLSSLLDILLLKKDIGERESLVDPLFNLLGDLSAIDWVQGLIGEDENQRDALSVIPETISEAISHVQQTTLHILQEITASILSHLPVADEVFSKFNIKLLVECARATQNVVTLNHVFWLLSSVAKVSSHWVSEYIFELFTIIGDSASKQSDSHSQHILEELISTLIPCWLAKTSNIKSLLQVFVNVLPEVPENRRLTLMVYLLRTLGEKGSLGVLIALLLHLLVAREVEASARGSHELLPASLQTEWEYIFAIQICDQYSCRIWLPSLVVMFQEIGADSELELFLSMQLVIQFVSQKLQDTELLFAVESGDDSDCLQRTLGELLEQVILQLRIIDRKQKQLCIHRIVRKQLKESMLGVLKSITRNMIPSEFFKAIGHLVAHEDGNVQKKALGLLSQTVKDRTMAQKKRRVARKAKQNFSNSNLLINENASVSLCELFSRIIQLVDEPEDSSPGPVRLAAVSSLDVLAKEFPNSTYISVTCLTVVVKHISSDNTALSSSCLRSAGALISVLGSKALSVLPRVMEQVLERTHNVSKCPTGMLKPTQAGSLEGLVTGKASILLSVLVVLEAVIENLGCFLNPYLESILDLVVLHPEYSSESDQKLKTKATLLRKLITEKIPVRLLLTAIMKLYKETLKCGETSISLAFEMLANMVSLMDKSSIGSYHAKIYEHCFLALDLRRQHPEMVKNVAMVEDNVIHAIIVLTMKLTESMFRPLFIHSLDWADFESEASDATKGSLYRKISFYKLVNRLAEQHRSLFVPYFKYLVEGCVHHLTDGEGVQTAALTRKRKKAKVGEECSDVKGVLSTEQWHLRTLILMSLYKCFLYDTGNLKFLDSSNFQVLLKPIVSQLVVEPPVLLDPSGDIPTVNAVDESLVCCLGQMAVTVGSDDIWKQLNHEVLMQTRSEKVRARILGLRVVKYLVEHLKEEYLVCLPETIPFLSELLEDLEPPVKSLSQEILRELESLSGENLRQYL
uniref:Uncharacterized protein At3g06530 n=1 Tax=Anthurium amnicola TaxID=1678845 RepID=A0A1D1XF93_9ARAE